MGGRGAGAGSHGTASRWTDEDLGIGGIMDDADGTITDRQLQYIRDLQRKLQVLADSGFPVSRQVAPRRPLEGEGLERAMERARRLGVINPERLSHRGASRFIDAV
jgi:hypothetical protein